MGNQRGFLFNLVLAGRGAPCPHPFGIVRINFPGIPTGFRLKAQGCARRATLGHRPQKIPTATRLRLLVISSVCQGPQPRRGCFNFGPWTQGRRWRANLGLVATIPLGLSSDRGCDAGLVAKLRLMTFTGIPSRVLSFLRIGGTSFTSPQSKPGKSWDLWNSSLRALGGFHFAEICGIRGSLTPVPRTFSRFARPLSTFSSRQAPADKPLITGKLRACARSGVI